MSEFIEWGALGDVVSFGLVIGAGLPALFALGVRALAGPGSRDGSGRPSPRRVAAAFVCFTVVVGAVATAIVIIASGRS